MPIPNVLTANNWKTQGLTLRTTLEKIKKISTGVSEALRDLAAADNGPAWEVLPKHTAYVATNQAITATINAHTGNAQLNTLLTNMRNGLPQVKTGWEHAIDGLTMQQAITTPALYVVFHSWGQTVAIEENIEYLHDKAAHMSPAALFTKYVPSGAPRELTLDDQPLVQALTQAPGHADPAGWAKVDGHVDTMLRARWVHFKDWLKHQL